MSINQLDAAAAMAKLTTYDYQLGTGYFVKVLIGKRYTLPTINYLYKFGMQVDEREQEDVQ